MGKRETEIEGKRERERFTATSNILRIAFHSCFFFNEHSNIIVSNNQCDCLECHMSILMLIANIDLSDWVRLVLNLNYTMDSQPFYMSNVEEHKLNVFSNKIIKKIFES